MMITMMANHAFGISVVLLLLTLLLSTVIHSGAQLQPSQSTSLLRIKELLNFPTVLSSWNSNTDFCNTEPTSSVTVVCYEETVTQLHIIGPSRGDGNRGPLLPPNFSIDSLFTNLVELPTLKVLTLVSLGLWGPLPANVSRLSSLEILNISSNYFNGSVPPQISSLKNLQTLILDHNLFVSGNPLVPPADLFASFPLALAVLSLRNNSFGGSLQPKSSLNILRNLRVLDLAYNRFSGQVPDLSGLANLEHLDLENNSCGPQFPRLGNKLVTLVLKMNKFRSGVLDEEIRRYYQLQKLDISSNKFMGPFPAASLLSLPSLAYLNVSRNRFTGTLFSNLSCNPGLESVDLSSNLLTGSLPKCLLDDHSSSSPSGHGVALYGDNCLSTRKQGQHPYAFCKNEALAAGVLPNLRNNDGRSTTTKAVAAVCVALGVAAGIVLLLGLGYLGWLLRTRRRRKSTLITRPPRLIAERAPTNTYSRKLLSDARYVSQTMKLGALGVPAYRAFSLEELEEATDNFNTSAFMGQGSHGQMYRGELKDGSFVAIRCVKLKKSHNTCTQQFMPHIELISKLRHRHLVSAIGHCFECYLEDSSVSRLFLVFEYVHNGTLESWIVDNSAGNNGQREQRSDLLSWSQRITTAIGVAKGIQFLQTGIVPGIFSNNLKTRNVLLDQNLVAKISSYNLPLLAGADNVIGNVGTTEAASGSPKDVKPKYDEDKSDVYDFGVILLEMIVGRSIKTRNELNAFRNQVQAGVMLDEATRRSIVAPEIEDVCSDQSLKTMMEICSRCMNKDPAGRPSIEDILWNLQFAAQVQDAWQRDSSRSSSGSSPSASSPPTHQIPRLRLALQ